MVSSRYIKDGESILTNVPIWVYYLLMAYPQMIISNLTRSDILLFLYT